MYLADTLSRTYPPEISACEFSQELEEVDHRQSLPVSEQRWQQLNHALANDYVCQHTTDDHPGGLAADDNGSPIVCPTILRVPRGVDRSGQSDLRRTAASCTSCGTH